MRCIVIAEKEAAEHRELDFHSMIAANNKVSSKPRTDHQVAPEQFSQRSRPDVNMSTGVGRPPLAHSYFTVTASA